MLIELNQLSESVIGACIEVHRALGPGLLESTYERCVAHELTIRGIPFERQVLLPLTYKGILLDGEYRVDFLVDKRIVVELKAVEKILPVHEAQLLSYLRLGNWELGLLVNFNVPTLVEGVKRRVLNIKENVSASPRL